MVLVAIRPKCRPYAEAQRRGGRSGRPGRRCRGSPREPACSQSWIAGDVGGRRNRVLPRERRVPHHRIEPRIPPVEHLRELNPPMKRRKRRLLAPKLLQPALVPVHLPVLHRIPELPAKVLALLRLRSLENAASTRSPSSRTLSVSYRASSQRWRSSISDTESSASRMRWRSSPALAIPCSRARIASNPA